MYTASSGGHAPLALLRALEQRREVHARDVLHRDEVRALGLAEVEHLHDVRVRERDRDLRLVDEHLDEARVLAELGQDALDDEDLLEALDAVRLGLEDLGHAAASELLEQLVLAVQDRSVVGHAAKEQVGAHARRFESFLRGEETAGVTAARAV